MAGYFWNRINFQDTAQTLSRDTRSRTQVASRGQPAAHGWEKARTARPESPPTAGMDGPGRMRKSLSLAARGRVFTAAAAATTRAPTASRAPQTGGGGLLARLPQSA